MSPIDLAAPPSPVSVVLPGGPGGDFASRLGAYRDLVVPLLLESVPRREPRRHLYEIVEKQLLTRGKGLRPALCIATCRAFGAPAERALPSAAAIELLHNAFLVHDDVEDSSEYRRDEPTLHRVHGVPIAVNVGDAMNAMSLRLLRRNGPLLGPELAARILDEFDHMSLETIEGQAMELGWIRDNDCRTTEEDYLLMVLKKTCWYGFIHPCRIGSMVARPGADPAVFDRFGYYTGAAFQIWDDVLNLSGDRSQYGKEIGGDLLEGKRTLILAHLLAKASPHERDRLKAFLGKPREQRLPREVAGVYEMLSRHGSIEYGRQAARQFAQAAAREFDVAYGDAPPGADLDFLRAFVEYLVRREV
jgi:geranylgeranyl diphosphate synthase type II